MSHEPFQAKATRLNPRKAYFLSQGVLYVYFEISVLLPHAQKSKGIDLSGLAFLSDLG